MTLSLAVNLLVCIIGILFEKEFLWIPISGFITSIIDKLTRNWVSSDKLGISVNLSIIIKFLFSLIMLYASLSIIASIVLLFIWFL